MTADILNAGIGSQSLTFLESSLTVDPQGPEAGVDTVLNMGVSCPDWNVRADDSGEGLRGDLRFEVEVAMADDTDGRAERMRARLTVLAGSAYTPGEAEDDVAELRLLESIVSLAFNACRERLFLLTSTSPMGPFLLPDISTSAVAADLIARRAEAQGD